MVSAGVNDDDDNTQRLDADSPALDSHQDTVPQDCTLPLDDDEACLFGETQAMEEEETECVGKDGLADSGETQVVDCEEEEEEEEEERTQVLSDGDDSDTTAACFRADECKDGGGVGSCEDQSRKVSDGGTTTDEDRRRSGTVKRSISDFRVASMRASSLSAARSMAWKSTDVENHSSVGRQYCSGDKKETVVGGQSIEVTENDNGLADARTTGYPEISFGKLRTVYGNDCLDMSTKNDYRDRMKQKVGNRTARKLFDEVVDAKEDNLPTNETNNNLGKEEMSCIHAGLSNIDSQEPGELSQANALNVVDNLLSLNDLELTQDGSLGKDVVSELPALSCLKGVQCLAKTCKGSMGKVGVFEWDDAVEDESGGDFFSKSRDLIFINGKHSRKSISHPPKSGRHTAGIRWSEDIKHKSLSTGIKIHNSSENDKLLTFETTAKKKLFKEVSQQQDAELVKQYLEEPELSTDKNHMNDIGPDTQMAAEAMEILVSGLPVEQCFQDTHPVTRNINGSGLSTTVKKRSLRHVNLQKGISLNPDSVGSTRRSKRLNLSNIASSSGSLISSRKGLRSSRTRNKIAEGSVITEGTASVKKSVKEKSKNENKLRVLNFLNENNLSDGKSLHLSKDKTLMKDVKSSTSVERRIEQNEVQTSITKMDKDSTHSKCAELSPSKELLQVDGTYTPVAHRTRKSRAIKFPKSIDALSDKCADKMDGAGYVYTAQVRGCRPSENEIHKKHEDSVLNQFDMHNDEHFIQDTRNGSHSVREVASCHPKRRRTCLGYSGDLNNAVNPVLQCIVPQPNLLPSLQQDHLEAVDKSIFMIQGKANSKKRTAVTGMPLEACEIVSNNKNGSMLSCVRTRSSSNSHRKESVAKLSNNKSFKGQIPFEYVVSNSSCSVDTIHEKMALEESRSPVEDAEHAGMEAPRKGKNQQPVSPCSSSLNKMNTHSPVCTGLDPLKTPHSKYLSGSSLAKELVRLEYSRMTSTPALKDTRRRKDMANVRALFSRHLGDDIIKQQKKILARLRVPVASSISVATHFIANEFVRTRNMLEAMAVGKPVVTHLWLESCGQVGCYIDEKNYILRDHKKEKEIGFSMPVSLAHASEHPLLQDKRVFITANVKPDRETVSTLVKASGGQPLERIVRSIMKDENIPDDLLIISCEEDYTICIPLLEKGSEVFSSELLLNGIVVQKLAYERHRLFSDHVRRTRSTIWLRTENSDRFLPVAKCK